MSGSINHSYAKTKEQIKQNVFDKGVIDVLLQHIFKKCLPKIHWQLTTIVFFSVCHLHCHMSLLVSLVLFKPDIFALLKNLVRLFCCFVAYI
jgi:hypothetical protein